MFEKESNIYSRSYTGCSKTMKVENLWSGW